MAVMVVMGLGTGLDEGRLYTCCGLEIVVVVAVVDTDRLGLW